MTRRLLLATVLALCALASWAQEAVVGGYGGATGLRHPPTEVSHLLGESPITVSVNGQSEAVPDAVIVRFMLVGDGETVTTSRQELKKTEDAVMEALSKLGVQRQRIALQHYEVIPLQTRPAGTPGAVSVGNVPFGFRVVQGYAIQLPVDVNRLDTLSQIIDVLVEKGARTSAVERGYSVGYYDSPSSQFMEFVVTDVEKLVQQATEDAIARARQMAGQLAGRMGYTNLKLQKVHVGSVSYLQAGIPGGMRGETLGKRISLPVWRPVQVRVQITAQFDTAGKEGR